mmetsp:Transcript_94560/g.170773  ORF Transcript_94560/g.170773 Transcript_94560/m.170773 type:complete len:287 (-) Transcript_94560:474-1334(-)
MSLGMGGFTGAGPKAGAFCAPAAAACSPGGPPRRPRSRGREAPGASQFLSSPKGVGRAAGLGGSFASAAGVEGAVDRIVGEAGDDFAPKSPGGTPMDNLTKILEAAAAAIAADDGPCAGLLRAPPLYFHEPPGEFAGGGGPSSHNRNRVDGGPIGGSCKGAPPAGRDLAAAPWGVAGRLMVMRGVQAALREGPMPCSPLRVPACGVVRLPAMCRGVGGRLIAPQGRAKNEWRSSGWRLRPGGVRPSNPGGWPILEAFCAASWLSFSVRLLPWPRQPRPRLRRSCGR